MSFHDFAGSTVVHTIGGFIALAGSIVLGPRLGRKFKRDGGAPMLPHDLTIAARGGLILWFGWYGFNPGSTLSAMDFVGIGRVATNTTLAACAAGLTSMFYGLLHEQEMGRRVHDERISGRARGHHLPLLLGNSDGRYPSRRRRRGPRRRWASSCWNICESMIPSARCRFTASAESGERCRWDFLPAGNYGATGPLAPDNQRTAQGSLLRRRHAGTGCPGHRQRIITLATFAVSMVVMSRSMQPGRCAPGGGRVVRPGSARAWHFGLSRICHYRAGRPDRIGCSATGPSGFKPDEGNCSSTRRLKTGGRPRRITRVDAGAVPLDRQSHSNRSWLASGNESALKAVIRSPCKYRAPGDWESNR